MQPAKAIVPPLCGYDSHRGVERDNDRYFPCVLERLIRESITFSLMYMVGEKATFLSSSTLSLEKHEFLCPLLDQFYPR